MFVFRERLYAHPVFIKHFAVYNVLFVNVMGSHLQSYSSLKLMPAVIVLSVVSLT